MNTATQEVTKNLNLETCLTIPVQLPDDFYHNPVYDRHIDNAIAASSNLVYELDEEGERKAKGDATSLNKYATLFDKFVAATYKTQTEQVSIWRDNKKAKVKALLANRQKLIDQFAERRQEKLDFTRQLLSDTLGNLWDQNAIKPEFRIGDVEAMVKLNGVLTPGEQLTKAAKSFLDDIVKFNLGHQTKIEARALMLENRCLKEDIAPLTKDHFGSVFYAEDSLFNDKLEQLIAAEKNRIEEMRQRLIRQQEAENQRKLDAALKAQQEEANRIARENAKAEQAQAKPEEKQAFQDNYSKIKEAIEKPVLPTQPDQALTVTGKRKVRVTAVFEFEISNRVSNAGAELFLKNKLPESLIESLIECSSKNGG